MSGAKLLPVLRQRYFDANGIPLVGGKLASYVAGTVTPAATFADQSGLVPNENPVILDADGEAAVWLGSGSYKFVLSDADDVVQWTVDNVAVDADGTGGLSPPWKSYAVTDGQAATDLNTETFDFATYSSATYDVEITRGTTVFSSGPGALAVQDLNGSARVLVGAFLANELHGVTFSVSQVGTVVQLRAALSAGPGNGTIKLLRSLVPV